MTTHAQGPDGDLVPDLERRLEEIVGVIQELAALRFDARATVGRAGDTVDAVAAGVNALGEELEASYQQIEQRVADRTAELAVVTRELRRRATRDHLTGLVSRAAFWECLEQRLADGPAAGFAVLFLDLDGFKAVNDTLGHAAGDQVLVEVARRITAQLRPEDTAARVGGDEFVVLLDDVATEGAALAAACRIGEGLRVPHELGGHRFTTAGSIGVALASARLATADAIVAAADAAMYDAKRAGQGSCVLHDPHRHGQVPLVGVTEPDGAVVHLEPTST